MPLFQESRNSWEVHVRSSDFPPRPNGLELFEIFFWNDDIFWVLVSQDSVNIFQKSCGSCFIPLKAIPHIPQILNIFFIFRIKIFSTQNVCQEDVASIDRTRVAVVVIQMDVKSFKWRRTKWSCLQSKSHVQATQKENLNLIDALLIHFKTILHIKILLAHTFVWDTGEPV